MEKDLQFAYRVDERTWAACVDQVSMLIKTETPSALKHSTLSDIAKVCHITKGKVS